MDLQGTFVLHKRYVSNVVWSRNMADNQGIYEEDPDLLNQCLRRILRIHWPETISNENLWARTRQTPVEEDIRRRRWRWLSHTLPKPPSSIGRQALKWNPQGQRKRGRPWNTCTWRREPKKDIKRTGHTWKKLERMDQDRGDWQVIIGGL